LRILKYVVVHDCGTVINPLIVAGQIQGGVAQGIGNAFYERLAFDEQGQLINGTLADYLLPTALDVPRIEILHHVTPSPYNELGVKGAGEAGGLTLRSGYPTQKPPTGSPQRAAPLPHAPSPRACSRSSEPAGRPARSRLVPSAAALPPPVRCEKSMLPSSISPKHGTLA